MTVYSFTDTTGAISHPLVGSFVIGGGNVGLGQISIDMAQDRTSIDVAADGGIMMSYIPGDNGTIAIEVQQTSELHAFLLNWFNVLKVAADAGDVSNWAAGAVAVRNLVDGSMHTASGVAPTKVPTKVYTKEGQKLTWTLIAASIVNE